MFTVPAHVCGIAGLLRTERTAPSDAVEFVASAMIARLAHRGPDGEGVWSDPRQGVALAHRRLAIVDLSPTGNQPMASASGRLRITFNGEIYNYAVLRKELEDAGIRFRGTSDTEVLVEAIEAWGLEATLTRVEGMYAFGLYDAKEAVLHLVRDRLGEKPLYYARVGDDWVFASELRAFLGHPSFHPIVDRAALSEFLRRACVPAPFSIYEGVRKLPPASIVTLHSGSEAAAPPRRYWSPPAPGDVNGTPPSDGEVERLLADAVGRAMVADVPVGVFLSGGVDSSLIAALASKAAAGRVQTFTVGFDDPAFDESPMAAAVAKSLGTNHRAVRVGVADALACARDIGAKFDEPFADASQIPTHLVARFARDHVKVCLSGDGGDELFGGYNRYVVAARWWRRIRFIPRPVRLAAATVASWVPARALERRARDGKAPQGSRSDRARKARRLLSARDATDVYERLTTVWENPQDVVVGGTAPATTSMMDRGGALEERMMASDLLGYLPDDLLVKLDRASMAVGLEARAPFLNHRVVETAAQVPLTEKIQGGVGKRILRNILARHLPRTLIERPKMGFAAPIAAWLRGPLRAWAEELLDEDRLRREGFFHPEPVRRAWQEHQSGRRNRQDELWCILMFQSWWAAQPRAVAISTQEAVASE